MLQREIDSMRDLHHPNVMEMQDVYEDDHFVHIVSDLCTGGELYERIGSGDWNATEKESSKLIQNILSAIAYLHENGVVHRDLKASNFLFVSKNTNTNVKVIDFGLAKKLPQTETSPRAMEQRLTTKVGTPYYVAPEVLLQDSYDSKCDVWSVGVIAYLVLSRGELPYCGEDEKQTIAMLKDPELQCEYEPEEIWAEWDNSATDFCQALMQRDPALRLSAQEALGLHWIVSMAGGLSPKHKHGRHKILSLNSRNAMENFFRFDWNTPRSPRGPRGEADDADVNKFYIENARQCNIQSNYTIQTEVGRGSFGIVRKVRKKHTRRDFACKTLRKNDKTPIHMLQREVDAMQGLHHKHIIEMQDVFEEPHFVHIVTELCRGDKLSERIGSNDWNNNATEQESAQLLQNILAAIAYLHKHGVVHRDLEASNIVFVSKSSNTNIKIIDFGFARKVPRKEGPADTSTYDVLDQVLTTKVGTPSYMAPEVLLQDSYNGKCDIWSVGVLAYFVLSGGKLPHCGEDEQQTFAWLKDPELQCVFEPAEIWDGLDGSAKDFCRALLQKDPAVRPTAKEALDLHWVQLMAGALIPKHKHSRHKILSMNSRNAMENFFRFDWNTPKAPRGPRGETDDANADERYIENARRCNVMSSYTIQMEVGRGSFGIVRKARKKHTRKDYACKTLRKNDKTPIPMLQREIECMQGLHHPCIIELQDVFEEPHFVHIITELCRGEELYERIGSGDWNATEQESAQLLQNMLSGIAYLHENGVVHRDLKASNFLFASKNTNTNVKIIDFGLARKVPLKEGPVDAPTYEILENVLTTKVGTPYYVAPEVLLQDSYNCKCDVWSIGVIAYLVLSRGKLPYCGDDEMQTCVMLKDPKLQCDYEPAKIWDDKLDGSAKKFCQALMQKDPGTRPTAQEALDLEWIQRMASSKARRRGSADDIMLDLFRTITRSHSKDRSEDSRDRH
ncbi:MAG: hypothetical protein SGBAC_012044 [Bacillariaceae sp.]